MRYEIISSSQEYVKFVTLQILPFGKTLEKKKFSRYTENKMASMKLSEEMTLRGDCLTDIDDLESCSVDDYRYILDDFSFLKDVARSKKFYLKKKTLNERIPDEMTDVFLDRSNDESADSEEEMIIQVVWSEDETVQSKLVKFVEALDVKKSNSKFTLSMLEDDHGLVDMDSFEGEDIKGRFLEVKDSLEVLATSTKSIHTSGAKYSDWDFSTEDDHEVNRIWRKNESPWTSSLQIEIGKLPSQAEQDIVLTVLDEGAQGRISVQDVAQCLGNVLNTTNNDTENNQNKKVSFGNKLSKSLSSKESLSQMSTQSQKSGSQKKVSFITECTENILESSSDKSSKKVSFYEIPYDDDDADVNLPVEGPKIKKSVSFHDSVEFQKSDKLKDVDCNESCNSEDVYGDLCSVSTTSIYSSSEKRSLSSNAEDFTGNSRVKNKISDANSGFSLIGSHSTFSTRTSIYDSEDFSENENRASSDLSGHLTSHDNEVKNLQVINYLNDVIYSQDESNDVDSGVGFIYNSKCSEAKSESESDLLESTKLNDLESNNCNCEISLAETHEFIKRMLLEALDNKLELHDAAVNFINENISLDNSEEIEKINSIGVFPNMQSEEKGEENKQFHESVIHQEKPKSESDLAVSSFISEDRSIGCVDSLNSSEEPARDGYETADSDQESAEVWVNNFTISDISLNFILSKYTYRDFPSPINLRPPV